MQQLIKHAHSVPFLVFLLAAAPVQATTLAPNPDLTVQGQGLVLAVEGTGLENIGDDGRFIIIDIGGPVRAAYLYWAGRDRPCPLQSETCAIPFQPYLDQELLFDGNPVVGTVIGTEAQPDINNIGYRADVTAIVAAKGPGTHSFNIKDGNAASNLYRLNGASLVVVYTDVSDPTTYDLIVFEGLDFAYGVPGVTPPNSVTVPVTFTYGSSTQARVARLFIAAGDAEPARPDRIDITDNASRVNDLIGADGVSWDSLKTDINIPAGVATTTVQLVSAPPDQNPDSLMWELGALRVPLEIPDQGCRVTGGGVDLNGLWNGSMATGKNGNGGAVDRYEFGGQAGAPTASPPEPRGEWTHHQQRGPDGSFVFHAGTSSAPPETMIARISCSDPGFCEPARPAPDKQIDFEGVGTFKNIKNPSPSLAGVVPGGTFHWFEVHIEDLGEPGKGGKQDPPAATCPAGGSAGTLADCDCPDYYHITIYAGFDPATESPNKTDVIYEVGGYINGGNLQIHPPIK